MTRVLASPPALAKEAPNDSWIRDEISLGGSAQIYLNATFTPKAKKTK